MVSVLRGGCCLDSVMRHRRRHTIRGRTPASDEFHR